MKLKDMLIRSSSSPPKVMDIVAGLPKMVNVSEQPNVEWSSKTSTRMLYSPGWTSHGIAMSKSPPAMRDKIVRGPWR